jgi:hypothetical protein
LPDSLSAEPLKTRLSRRRSQALGRGASSSLL